jgi:4-aminobutyrate aminotransferase/(S)-3-amino-2-methylpropionate transaminase
MERRFSKILAVPPGPKALETLRREAGLMAKGGLRPYPLIPRGGEGCVLTDVDGNSYIDFSSGGGLLILGHNHPKIIEARDVYPHTLRPLFGGDAYVGRDALRDNPWQLRKTASP